MEITRCPICGRHPRVESTCTISCCGYSFTDKTVIKSAEKWNKFVHDRELIMNGSILSNNKLKQIIGMKPSDNPKADDKNTKGEKDMNRRFKFKVANMSINNIDQDYRFSVDMTPIYPDLTATVSSSDSLKIAEYIDKRLNGDMDTTNRYKYAMNTIYGITAFNRLTIIKVIFNNPATIVFWSDGTKTIVKAQDGEVYDPEKGLALAISKKALGNQGNYYNEFDKWLNPDEEDK